MSIWNDIQSLFANFVNWLFQKFSFIGDVGNWFIEDFGTNNILALTKILGTFVVIPIVYAAHIRLKGGKAIKGFVICARVLLAECFFGGLLIFGVLAIKNESRGELGFIAFFSVFVLLGLFGLIKGWSILTEYSQHWDDTDEQIKQSQK